MAGHKINMKWHNTPMCLTKSGPIETYHASCIQRRGPKPAEKRGHQLVPSVAISELWTTTEYLRNWLLRLGACTYDSRQY
jgi:hypothetical protein